MFSPYNNDKVSPLIQRIIMAAFSLNASREVYCTDAISWLKAVTVSPAHSYVASLPDISEFPNYKLTEWRNWFVEAATLILSKTPPTGVAIFFQSDVKVDGTWVDKSYLCQQAAERVGAQLLWHKIAARIQPGQTSFGRPSYSHIVCFSQKLRLTPQQATPDILPILGEKTWVRGMGMAACLLVAKFIRDVTPSDTVVNPFCGQGSVLAAANYYGLNAIGIERSNKRAELARGLRVNESEDGWIKGSAR